VLGSTDGVIAVVGPGGILMIVLAVVVIGFGSVLEVIIDTGTDDFSVGIVLDTDVTGTLFP